MAEEKTLYVTLGFDERGTRIKSITSSAQDDEEFAIIKAFMRRLRLDGEDAPPSEKTFTFQDDHEPAHPPKVTAAF
jgi:hypothetical protein